VAEKAAAENHGGRPVGAVVLVQWGPHACLVEAIMLVFLFFLSR
jgi:hypothetical protein